MTVELKEFVRQTLTDILRAVSDAGDDQTIGPLIAPWGIGNCKLSEGSGAVTTTKGFLTVVKFDVAVTAETTDAAKGGGGFKVAVMSVGASAGAEAQTAAKNVAATHTDSIAD
jgi:hypothetical protein